MVKAAAKPVRQSAILAFGLAAAPLGPRICQLWPFVDTRAGIWHMLKTSRVQTRQGGPRP
jgi:hypothetical protein